MKVLLVGINAKFVQINLAIRLLRSFAQSRCTAVTTGLIQIEIAEWNINLPVSAAVRGIFERCPDMVLFSTYIWNREFTLQVCAEIRMLLPKILIGLGGPEVSWSAEKTFKECAAADFILAGEGEQTFADLVDRLADSREFSDISGLYWRTGDRLVFGGERPVLSDLSQIPFPYGSGELDFDPENRIVYYESSRGCPFQCAYCLSSIDKSVRYYPLDRVLAEIGFFMEKGFPLVKFVDRTFNLDPDRYLAIWRYIRDHHNGKTLFHFEIAAEFLADEAFDVLETMPEGSIQFEIGIQSINPETLRLVGRPAHTEILAEKIRRIPSAIHTHVDLIAGLPAEDIASFERSFNFAFSLDAGMLQLGFLKILAGSAMEKIAHDMDGYIASSVPPYEVLASPVLPYRDLLVLKEVEHILDTWYNSGLLRNSLNYLVSRRTDGSAFRLFREIALFVRSYFPDADLFLPRRPADLFACMAAFLARAEIAAAGTAREWLKYDYLLQGKPGAFPPWFERRYSRDEHDRALMDQGLFVAGESRRTLYARSEFESFAFRPDQGDEKILFVYSDFGARKSEKKAQRVRVYYTENHRRNYGCHDNQPLPHGSDESV
jgi:Fe-S oxidoreductase